MSAFPPPVLLHDHRDADSCQRSSIFQVHTFGPENFDFLHARRQAGRNLNHARVEFAGKSINFAQRLYFHRKAGIVERIQIGIKPAVRRVWWWCHSAAAIADSKPCGFARAFKRRFGQLCRVGISGRFAPNGPQTEPFGCVIAGGFDPAVVQYQRFGAAALKKKFAIIGTGSRLSKGCETVFQIQIIFKRLKPRGVCGHFYHPMECEMPTSG